MTINKKYHSAISVNSSASTIRHSPCSVFPLCALLLTPFIHRITRKYILSTFSCVFPPLYFSHLGTLIITSFFILVNILSTFCRIYIRFSLSFTQFFHSFFRPVCRGMKVQNTLGLIPCLLLPENTLPAPSTSPRIPG